METIPLKRKLLQVLKKTCEKLWKINNDDSETGSRLFIPQKNDENRISEQELRFAFIESFLEDDSLKECKFSVETPTKKTYRFTEDRKKIKPKCCDDGRKANMDLTIYDKDEMICMIEFKAKNTDFHSHAKDFIKLTNEPEKGSTNEIETDSKILRLFVEIYISTDNRTLESIYDKLYHNDYGNIGENTDYIGVTLKHGEEKGWRFIGCKPKVGRAEIVCPCEASDYFIVNGKFIR